jgi:hypothetical protein
MLQSAKMASQKLLYLPGSMINKRQQYSTRVNDLILSSLFPPFHLYYQNNEHGVRYVRYSCCLVPSSCPTSPPRWPEL